MIDEKKIEEAAEEYAMDYGEVASLIKDSFIDGAIWVLTEVLNDTKQKEK